MSKIIIGTFTSVWDDMEIITEATLNTSTGEVDALISEEQPEGCLEREYFTDDEGDIHKVCTDCHQYVMKAVINPDNVGNGLHEDEECSNPNCDSHN